jgi:hypothetical protein
MRHEPLATSIIVLLLAAAVAHAQMPLARLTAIFPPGGQCGTQVEMTLTGSDLDGVNRLWFSDPGISAVPVTVGSKFLISIDRSVRPGLYDVRAIGLFGVTDPRTLEVTGQASLAAKGGNSSADTAIELPVGSSIFCRAEANVEQFYRIAIKSQAAITVDVSTTALDSKMEPITVVSDASGHELGRSRRAGEPIRIESPPDGTCFIRVHDLLYRSGAEYFYRLRVTAGNPAPAPHSESIRWPFPPAAAFLPALPAASGATSMRGSESTGTNSRAVDPPCEIDGQFRHPRQADPYTFDAPAGSAYWIEVISHRLGQDTSPFFLVQRVDRNAKGIESFVDVQEVYAPAPPAAVPEFPLGSRDPIYRFEAKKAGAYRVLVRDLFARERVDHPAAYHLSIRHDSPDFQLVAMPQSPLPDPADSKDVPIWTTLLRRGGTTPVKVLVVRRDGFGGPITLQVDGLPPDIVAGPAIIPDGASSATIILQAAEAARTWTGPITFHGVGHIDSGELSRIARPATVSFSEYDAANKSLVLLRSRLTEQFLISVSGVEDSPIAIAPAQSAFNVPTGGKVAIAFDIRRRAQFDSAITLSLAGYPGAAKPLTINPKSDKASVELDLSQTKLPPGRYALHFERQAKVKYADSPDLRNARVVQMQAEAHAIELSQRCVRTAETVGDAIKAHDLRLSISRVGAFAASEWNWMRLRQSEWAAESHADEVAAHAPAKDLAVSLYSQAFELDVTPPVAK